MNRYFDPLRVTFAALSDPTGRAMLLRLSQGEVSESALGEPFLMSLPAATKHLRVLERAGLAQKGRDAQRRPCRINAEALRQGTDWMAQYRQFREGSIDRLDAYLHQLQALEKAQESAAQAQEPNPLANVKPAIEVTISATFNSAAKKCASKSTHPLSQNIKGKPHEQHRPRSVRH